MNLHFTTTTYNHRHHLHTLTQLNEAMPIRDALAAVLRHAKEGKLRKFAETVDLAIQLGVDPRKPNQSVRGVQTLPNGTGKAVRVAVFARGDVRWDGTRQGGGGREGGRGRGVSRCCVPNASSSSARRARNEVKIQK